MKKNLLSIACVVAFFGSSSISQLSASEEIQIDLDGQDAEPLLAIPVEIAPVRESQGPLEEKQKKPQGMSQAEAIDWLLKYEELEFKLFSNTGCFRAGNIYTLKAYWPAQPTKKNLFMVEGYNTCKGEVSDLESMNADLLSGDVALWGEVYHLGDHGLLLHSNGRVAGRYWQKDMPERYLKEFGLEIRYPRP
jgi:hypothetical protein